MKHNCKNCHFLNKQSNSTGKPFNFSWSKSERDREQLDTHWSVGCWHGVWEDPNSGSSIEDIKTEILRDRKEECFFWPHSETMLYPAAKELQTRSQQNKELKRSNLYTRIGLWIAALGLLANALTTLLSTIGE